MVYYLKDADTILSAPDDVRLPNSVLHPKGWAPFPKPHPKIFDQLEPLTKEAAVTEAARLGLPTDW